MQLTSTTSKQHGDKTYSTVIRNYYTPAYRDGRIYLSEPYR